jgi:hypothetical protein
LIPEEYKIKIRLEREKLVVGFWNKEDNG